MQPEIGQIQIIIMTQTTLRVLDRNVTPFTIAGLPVYASIDTFLRGYRGDSHVYVLYPEKIRAQAALFLTGLRARTLYAVKSNPNPAVIQILAESGVSAFDVASIREIDLVKGIAPSAELYLMHPVKSRGLIAHAVSNGVRHMSLDCMDELMKIRDAKADGRDMSLHIRIALPKGGAALPLTGKFGADFDGAIALLRAAKSYAGKVGICFHVGSQCMNPADYDRAIGYARKIADAAGVKLDSLDVGGGFPVAYPGMDVAPMSDYFDVIHSALSAHGFDGTDIIAEPGRALCAEAGSTLVRVDLRKGQDLYINDGTYGSLFDAGQCEWRYPTVLHRTRPPAPMQKTDAFRFFGPTCDSLDVMNGPFILPADASEGDWIEVQNLGAYGQAIAGQFNGYYAEQTIAII